jgi:hypothetical protein
MTRKLPVTPNDQITELLEVVCSLGVTGSYLVIESYWKLSGDWDLLKVVWSLVVTGSCLVIASYWKLSGHGELLPNHQTTSSNSYRPENFQ